MLLKPGIVCFQRSSQCSVTQTGVFVKNRNIIESSNYAAWKSLLCNLHLWYFCCLSIWSLILDQRTPYFLWFAIQPCTPDYESSAVRMTICALVPTTLQVQYIWYGHINLINSCLYIIQKFRFNSSIGNFYSWSICKAEYLQYRKWRVARILE